MLGRVSFFVRGCGLKSSAYLLLKYLQNVILRVRMWIEVASYASYVNDGHRHPPCEGEGALLIIFTSKAYKKTTV